MTVRVAIMGFGRIGRAIFRLIYNRDDMEVVAISDIAEPKAMEYLLHFDSLHGRFDEPVQVFEGFLYAKGRRIAVLNHRDPSDCPWFDCGVDVVVEATGRYRKREELQKHLDAGADRVVMTTLPTDTIDAVHFLGSSDAPLSRKHRIISCGSSTANCTLAMIKVLQNAIGVESAFFTSIHAYTSEQHLIDVPSSDDLRLSRAAVENIVPVESWTRKAVEDTFEHLRGKIGGMKLYVPVPDVSCVDLVTTHPRDLSVGEVNAIFRSASASVMKGVVDFTDDPIVSTDVVGSSASCTYDSLATMVVQGNMLKTLGWYDQGGGLANRIVDVIGQLAPQTGVKS